MTGSGGDARIARQLRFLARLAPDARAASKHVDEPLLALLRDGDLSEDLDDARSHLACCVDCRARLVEGDIESRKYVVLAIEAPRASARDLAAAAQESSARLVERGEGRWTAVVPASKAGDLQGRLEKPEKSVVSRIGVGAPFEVPVDELRAARQKLDSEDDVPVDAGTDAAEVQAWAQVAHKPPKKNVSAGSAGWLLFAIAAIGLAVGVAYLLATR